MNRLDDCFARLIGDGDKALIPFFTAGDPDLSVTQQMVLAAEKNGADIVEIGVPFTDPMESEPAIRQANARAIEQGVCLNDIFQMICFLRRASEIPIVLFIYYNSLLHYGADRFFRQCRNSGVDAVAVPDLPLEESDEIFAYTQQYDVYQILFVSPTSRERMAEISNRARGFLHCVSAFEASQNCVAMLNHWKKFLSEVRQTSSVPAVVGLDTFSSEQSAELLQHCGGGVIEYEIAQTLVQAGDAQEVVFCVENIIKEAAKKMGKA